MHMIEVQETQLLSGHSDAENTTAWLWGPGQLLGLPRPNSQSNSQLSKALLPFHTHLTAQCSSRHTNEWRLQRNQFSFLVKKHFLMATMHTLAYYFRSHIESPHMTSWLKTPTSGAGHSAAKSGRFSETQSNSGSCFQGLLPENRFCIFNVMWETCCQGHDL